MDLIDILKSEGYEVVKGYDNVKKAIKEKADDINKKLCSGYGVFPDGRKCTGCNDCEAV